MNNLVTLIGRLVDKLIVEENENGRKVSTVTLAIPRSFRNEEGVYDTDFIECTLWGKIAESVNEYCEKGDLIAIKGRLQRLSGNALQVVAEKVSFLVTGNKGEE